MGATVTVVKAIASEQNKELRSHGEIYKFVSKLSIELADNEIERLFAQARELHQNFYENWLPKETIIDHGKAVEEFICKLEPLLKNNN